MAAIKKMYPTAPNYVSYKRSNWGIDPYSQGSYPFVKAGATPDDCATYQEHQISGNRLYFAGDGTTCELIGTVHGAYITGVAAATAAITSQLTAITSAATPYLIPTLTTLCLSILAFVL